jgi:hypothetical protein
MKRIVKFITGYLVGVTIVAVADDYYHVRFNGFRRG